MATFDTVTETIKEIPYQNPNYRQLSMTNLKSNEVLFVFKEGFVAKFFRFGSESAWVSSSKDYPEMKEIVAENKTQFDINKAIRFHDPELVQLVSLEEEAVYRW